MTERTRRRASFCLRSKRKARWDGRLVGEESRGPGLFVQDTITPRRPPGLERGTREAGRLLLCSPHALVGSTESGLKMHPVGGLRNNMRRLAIRPRRNVASWVSHNPNILPKSSLGESMDGYTGSRPTRTGQRCGKGGGAGGPGSMGRVAPLSGHDDDDSARRRFELRSGFPRIRTQPQTGPVYWVAVA